MLHALAADLAAPLKHIVVAELRRGNKIVDVGRDYPEQGSVHITLRDRFDDRYASKDAVFSLCNDPHYWHADYTTMTYPRHLLIC
ncbi:hypothetical protein RU07_19140 [Agrobacterium tumefaciens]|uniref:Uncharacterized protein n=1 Tax=Agrobacterium tumefaciens TaxID=358 RepID=A0A0D0KLA4_AGRTU|nr:hypothetical protein RU07_19140 [Agrobacterium tumefaciens]